MTLFETTVAVAVMGVLVVIVAQCLASSLHERARLGIQQAALELAANVLESARAQPWEQLDKSWAEAQSIPPDMAVFLPDGKVLATVQPWQPEAETKRLTVEVSWRFEGYLPPESVQLTTLLSGRKTKKAGGQP